MDELDVRIKNLEPMNANIAPQNHMSLLIRTKSPLRIIALAVSIISQSQAALYWTDAGTNKIQRSNLDGSQVTDVVTAPTNFPNGIAYDSVSDRVYWTNSLSGNINSVTAGGTGLTQPISGSSGVIQGLAVAGGLDKMFWASAGDGVIRQSSLSGLNVSNLVTGLLSPNDVAVDTVGGLIYWTEIDGDRIGRANLDGTNKTFLVSTGAGTAPAGLALDTANGFMYWTDVAQGLIMRSDINGGSVTQLISGMGLARDIALDSANGHMYFINDDDNFNTIYRANLDGSGLLPVVTGLDDPFGLIIAVPEPSSCILLLAGLISLSHRRRTHA